MSGLKKTLVLGASVNPARYSFLALRKLQAHGHPVVAIGKRKGKVGEVDIETEHIQFPDIDTITLYLNPTNQQQYIDYILSLKPKRIIFNPGTENNQLIQTARSLGIMPVVGCTLVMLSVGTY
ncbi:MAG: CoA-binding protein [Chitinophagaceae bacterium]